MGHEAEARQPFLLLGAAPACCVVLVKVPGDDDRGVSGDAGRVFLGRVRSRHFPARGFDAMPACASR